MEENNEADRINQTLCNLRILDNSTLQNIDISSYLQITSMKAYRKYMHQKSKSCISHVPLFQLESEKVKVPKVSMPHTEKTAKTNNVATKTKKLFDYLLKKSNKRKYSMTAESLSTDTQTVGSTDILYSNLTDTTSSHFPTNPFNHQSPLKIGSNFHPKYEKKNSGFSTKRPYKALAPFISTVCVENDKQTFEVSFNIQQLSAGHANDRFAEQALLGHAMRNIAEQPSAGHAMRNIAEQTLNGSGHAMRNIAEQTLNGSGHANQRFVSQQFCLETIESLQRNQLKSLHENIDQRATIESLSNRIKVLERIIDSITPKK
jgi:hypothetical protein